MLEQLLSYEYKEIVKERWTTVTKRTHKIIYREVDFNGVTGLETFQGMWFRVTEALKKAGIPYTWSDQRDPRPAPRLDLMYGFWHKQEELTRKTLEFGYSGKCEIVTRYGKTACQLNIFRANPGLPAVWLAPGSDILDQNFKAAKEQLIGRDVKMIGGFSRTKVPSDDITVCSMDSMHHLDPDRTRTIVIDEAHELPTTSRIPVFARFNRARIYGYSGSMLGRFDGRDIITEGLIGPTIVRKTYLEALAEGAVCEMKVIFLHIPLDVAKIPGGNRHTVYNTVLRKNTECVEMIRFLCDQVIPADKQTLIFIHHEEQADMIYNALGGDTRIGMAKVLTDKERAALTKSMKLDELKRCVASDIFSTGITFSQLGVVLNVAGGGGSISCVQKPGRLLQPMKGKRCGVMFEFMFTEKVPGATGEAKALITDSMARQRVYHSKGYTLLHANSVAEVEKIYRAECL